MQAKLKLALAMFAGVLIGAAGAVAIHIEQAQAEQATAQPQTPPGYFIAEVDVTDPATMQRYGAKVPETLAPFNHRYLVRSRNVQTLEGDPPKGGIVEIQFESVEKAREWYDSPAYAAIRPIRQSAAKSRIFIVEGLPPQ